MYIKHTFSHPMHQASQFPMIYFILLHYHSYFHTWSKHRSSSLTGKFYCGNSKLYKITILRYWTGLSSHVWYIWRHKLSFQRMVEHVCKLHQSSSVDISSFFWTNSHFCISFATKLDGLFLLLQLFWPLQWLSDRLSQGKSNLGWTSHMPKNYFHPLQYAYTNHLLKLQLSAKQN